jgi:hypothetical protein
LAASIARSRETAIKRLSSAAPASILTSAMLRSSWQCVPFAGQAWVDYQSALKGTGGYKWIWDADDEHGEHCTRIVYVKDQMGLSSIQVTVDIYGHLIPGANVCSLTDSMEAFRKRQEQVRHNPQPPRNRAKWRFRQIFCKLLKDLVAAVGLEPTTYGL